MDGQTDRQTKERTGQDRNKYAPSPLGGGIITLIYSLSDFLYYDTINKYPFQVFKILVGIRAKKSIL